MGIAEIISAALTLKNLLVSITQQVKDSQTLSDMDKAQFISEVLKDKDIPQEWL